MTPQQVAWHSAYDFVAKDLDSGFAKLHSDILNRCTILDKAIRFKVAAWLKKLSEEKSNEVWKKNRNAYARLMLDQLKAGRLEEPFNAVPPSSPLPVLPKSLTYAYSKPKRSAENHTKITPSQQLESYLTSHGAPPSPLPCALQSNSQDTATPNSYGANNSLGTSIPAMSAPYAAASAPGDGGRDSRCLSWAFEEDLRQNEAEAGAERQRDLEFRVMQAEEMLLELSSILTRIQQQERQQSDSKGMRFHNLSYSGEQASPRGHQYDHSLTEDVVQRAESALRGFNRTRSPSRRSAQALREAHKDYNSSSMAKQDRNDLSSVLYSFEERTRALRGVLEKGGFVVHRGASEINTGLPALSPLAQLPSPTPLPILSSTSDQDMYSSEHQKQQPRTKERTVTSSGNGAGAYVRHTLKSAAAAAAATTKLAIDNNDDSPRITDLPSGNRTTRDGVMRRTSPVLLPRPGSTAALVGQVSDLRKKLAASVARMQSGVSARHCLG